MTHFSSLNRVGPLAALLLVGISLTVHAQTITTFDAPNSTMTVPQATNLLGQITGNYQDASGLQYGFLREQDGTFISFVADQNVEVNATVVTDINVAGQIIGYVSKPQGGFPGFLRQTDGTIVLFTGGTTSSASIAEREPAASLCTPYDNCVDGTGPIAINAFGQIAGAVGQGQYFGFLRNPDGTVIEFNADPAGVLYTIPQGINALGQVAGYYRSAGVSHGFLRQRNGTVLTFDPPASTRTTPQSINLWGRITGYYLDTNNVVHAFLRQPNGTIITFDPTGSIATQAVAINLEGQITGFYSTVDGIYHGFLRRANGNIETFDIPGGGNGGTFAKDINDLGQIVGYYQDANFVLHGFVRSPR